MLSIGEEKFIEFENDVSVVRVKMFADTVEELPAMDEFTGKKLTIGSECCVTGTGDRYVMTSTGEWVKLNFNGGGEGGGGDEPIPVVKVNLGHFEDEEEEYEYPCIGTEHIALLDSGKSFMLCINEDLDDEDYDKVYKMLGFESICCIISHVADRDDDCTEYRYYGCTENISSSRYNIDGIVFINIFDSHTDCCEVSSSFERTLPLSGSLYSSDNTSAIDFTPQSKDENLKIDCENICNTLRYWYNCDNFETPISGIFGIDLKDNNGEKNRVITSFEEMNSYTWAVKDIPRPLNAKVFIQDADSIIDDHALTLLSTTLDYGEDDGLFTLVWYIKAVDTFDLTRAGEGVTITATYDTANDVITALQVNDINVLTVSQDSTEALDAIRASFVPALPDRYSNGSFALWLGYRTVMII